MTKQGFFCNINAKDMTMVYNITFAMSFLRDKSIVSRRIGEENLLLSDLREKEEYYMRTLMKGGTILTLDKDDQILETGDILIKDGVIQEISREISAEADEVIDCSTNLIMPGLINSHLHSDENMFKGAFDNLPLEQWMLYSCPPLSYGPFSERLIYLRTMIGAMEMIKHGVITVQDDVSECPKGTFEGYSQVFQAYKDIGMKANVALNMGNREYCDKLPFAREVIPDKFQKELEGRPNEEELLELYQSIVDKWDRKDGLKVVVSSSAPQRCSDGYLMKLKSFAEEYDLPMHTHILETRVQRVTGDEFYGKSIVKHIQDIGFLSSRLTVIHGVWMDEEDYELLGKAGASLAHNPVSNLKLGSGIMPLIKAVQAGVNVVLGTDGMSSNDGQNIFEAMKFAALLQKVTTPDYRQWLSSRQIIAMATENGAKSLRRTKETGSLEPGKDGDLILLDKNSISFTPCNNYYNQLVYCEHGESVKAAMVKGKMILKDGKLCQIDERKIKEELMEISEDFKERFRYTQEKNRKLMPYIDEIYRRSVTKLEKNGINLFS